MGRKVIVAATLAIALTALTILGSETRQPATAQAAGLVSATLRPTDLPSGWRIGGALDSDAGTSFFCPTVPQAVLPLGRLGLLLTSADSHQMAYQMVAQYAPGTAAAVVAGATGAPGLCSWGQSLDDGGEASVVLSPPASLALGDEAASRRLELHADALSVQAEIVLVRHGDYLTTIAYVVIGRDWTADDTALAWFLAVAAEQRLAAAAD